MSAYKAVSVRNFVGKMVLDLTRRLADFESEVMRKQKENPELAQVKSRRQWLVEYALWCYREDNHA
jgi:hypothetical protein